MTTQQDRAELIDRSDAVNLARNMLEVHDCKGLTENGVRVLCEAVMRMDAALLAEDARGGEAVAEFVVEALSPAMMRGDFTDKCWWHKLPPGKYHIYTHHQPERVPLTADKLKDLWLQTINRTENRRLPNEVYFGRLVESSHHIGKPAQEDLPAILKRQAS